MRCHYSIDAVCPEPNDQIRISKAVGIVLALRSSDVYPLVMDESSCGGGSFRTGFFVSGYLSQCAEALTATADPIDLRRPLPI